MNQKKGNLSSLQPDAVMLNSINIYNSQSTVISISYEKFSDAIELTHWLKPTEHFQDIYLYYDWT